ncbi:HNH endonuclease [Aeromonas veronii]|uniref:HNH endonuclease n=1 Tax=Aeromonas veronii TaxID=654 RepID=UPI001BCD9274|nr:HNH endonuclease [Aeromonas veronii]MBS4704696.1 HNH endonuclease [Aeromonas veronii]
MQISSVIFNDAEKQKIKSIIERDDFGPGFWSDKDIEDLKSKIKSHYLAEQKNTCPYCQQKINSNHGRYWDIEHIIPRSIAPTFMFEPLNLCVSCVECNSAKSDKKVTNSKAVKKYPQDSASFFIVHPLIDDYHSNIIVIKPGCYYLAKKSKGEKTIEVCKLNRFYEFAEFGASVQDDDRIFHLSEELRKTQDETHKKTIRKLIAELAIKGAA